MGVMLTVCAVGMIACAALGLGSAFKRKKRRRKPRARSHNRFTPPRWWSRLPVRTTAQKHQIAALITKRWHFPEERNRD